MALHDPEETFNELATRTAATTASSFFTENPFRTMPVGSYP
jgi:hypothetical protein